MFISQPQTLSSDILATGRGLFTLSQLLRLPPSIDEASLAPEKKKKPALLYTGTYMFVDR